MCCIVLSYRENVFYSIFLHGRRRVGVVYHLKQSFNTHTLPPFRTDGQCSSLSLVSFYFLKKIFPFFKRKGKQNCFYFFRLYSKLFVLHILAGTAFRVTAVFITVFRFFFVKDTTSSAVTLNILASVSFFFQGRHNKISNLGQELFELSTARLQITRDIPTTVGYYQKELSFSFYRIYKPDKKRKR